MSLDTLLDSKSSFRPNNIVSEEADKLCQECTRLSLSTFFSTSRPVSESDDPHERWGSFAERDFLDIKSSVHCPLCRLICKAIPKSKRSRRPKSKDRIYFYRMLFGEYEREHIPSSQDELSHWRLHRTNRLLVSTIPQILNNVGREFARFTENYEHQVVDNDSEGWISFVGNKQKDSDNFFLHGRSVASQFDFNLARRWIDTCIISHGDDCSLQSSHEELQRPLRLINVKDRRVEGAPSTCSYAVLSYRWPDKSLQFMLGAETRDRLTALNGLADDHEDVLLLIRDAMIVCGQLSIPYLWVDALCVMQDDPLEVDSQMKAFADIYEGAQLTIAAASIRGGLPGIRGLSRTSQQTADCNNCTLAVARLDFDSAMETEPLGTRRWIFQEFLKSRRLLIFTDSQVFFKCVGGLWCEDTEQEYPETLENIRNITIPKSTALWWKEFPRGEVNFFECYVKQLENYTPRKGSSENDVLKAFDSFAQMASKLLGTEFFYGLPEKFISWALLFDVSWGIPREGNYPSWSWCAWNSNYSIKYDSEDELRTFISCNDFYRVEMLPSSAKKILLIGDESGRNHLSYLINLPAGLTDSELGYLLIFEAQKAHVRLDREQDRFENYPVRIQGVKGPESSNEKPMGTVHMDTRLRRRLGGELFECIKVSSQYRPFWKGDDLNVKLMLIKTDNRGVSSRIGLFETRLKDWLQALPTMKMVYLI